MSQTFTKLQRQAMANMIRACEEMTERFTREEVLTFAINLIDILTSNKNLKDDTSEMFQSVDEDVLFSIPYRKYAD
jgi:hypothetical protein